MMEKTKLIFKDDVKNGYIHYINFKRDFSGALQVFRKYVLPVECKISIDANNNWLILILCSDSELNPDVQELLERDWDTLTEFLKEEDINYYYPSWYAEWSMIITIDEFAEWVLKSKW